MTINVILDNGGGVTIQTDKYAHYYTNPAQAAHDYNLLLGGSDTGEWDGNEPDIRQEYDNDIERNGGYLWLTQDDIASPTDHMRTWGRNAETFFAALEKYMGGIRR
jgi:hypothetical protein